MTEAQLWAAIVERRDRLYKFVLGLTRDRHDAEDIVSATMLKALRYRRTLRNEKAVNTWLYKIAIHSFLDEQKRMKPLLFGSNEELEQHLAYDGEAALDLPLLQKVVRLAVMELPLAQREVVVLHHLQGWTYDQIAQKRGTTETAVKMRAYKAHIRLRKLLEDYGYEWRGQRQTA